MFKIRCQFVFFQFLHSICSVKYQLFFCFQSQSSPPSRHELIINFEESNLNEVWKKLLNLEPPCKSSKSVPSTKLQILPHFFHYIIYRVILFYCLSHIFYFLQNFVTPFHYHIAIFNFWLPQQNIEVWIIWIYHRNKVINLFNE